MTSERQFQSNVLELATLMGWEMQYHTHDARRSPAGFPDLVLVRPPRIVFAELKSETGRASAEQWAWLDALQACDGVEAYLWYPSQWDEIARILKRGDVVREEGRCEN